MFYKTVWHLFCSFFRQEMGGVMSKKNKKKEFVEKVLHDIQTPLSVIQYYSKLDPNFINNANMKTLHNTALLSLEKIRKLIESVKDFDSKNSLKRNICDITTLIKNVFAELKMLADKKEINLHFIGPDHLLVLIDKLSVERVIQNLVKNAIQASNDCEDRFIEVRLLQKDDAVLIDVRDNGCGIALQNIERIFEKGVTFGDHNGSGIGLDYCKEIIEKHNGTITVHSQVNQGTLFSIVLPKAAIAACNISSQSSKSAKAHNSVSLQIWSVDNQDERMNSWIEKWQKNHQTKATVRVDSHNYMIETGEDSLGYS